MCCCTSSTKPCGCHKSQKMLQPIDLRYAKQFDPPAGFLFTGVFAEPAEGDWFLTDSGKARLKDYRGSWTGTPRHILCTKTPKFWEPSYASQNDPPEGYEYTGEFRVPVNNEDLWVTESNDVGNYYSSSIAPSQLRHIIRLKKTEEDIEAERVAGVIAKAYPYGVPETPPGYSRGTFVEGTDPYNHMCRKPGEFFLGNCGNVHHDNSYYNLTSFPYGRYRLHENVRSFNIAMTNSEHSLVMRTLGRS